ncbi:MAG: hypothetical protein MJ211_10020 [Bacteroidales bacterium]|nr:hypothetical protein [Bacteroidales bacterium]
MAKTFLDIRLMLADVYMSNIDPDDMVSGEEEKDQVIRSLNSTHTELMGKYPYSFLDTTTTLITEEGQSVYGSVSGQIAKNGIILLTDNATKVLEYKEDAFILESKEGEPEYFYFAENEKIILYPTPDKEYEIIIKFHDSRYAIDTSEEPTNEYADDNTINMPERLQDIYIEWLLYQTLGDYMRNQSKPRWQPTLQIAENKKNVFLNMLSPYDGSLRFIV